MANNKKITVTSNATSIDTLKQYASGTLVELPPFGEGQPFYAKLKRPSLLALAKSGKIPNTLLETANSLFTGDNRNKALSKKASDDYMKNAFEIFELLCEASFCEPTWGQLQEAGVELTDDQLIFVFNYTQNGVKALKSFREE